ncbi:DUF6660 family protein [Flavobacterium sp. ZS1P14]
MSIYIVALSCLPCADLEVDSSARSSAQFIVNNDNHSHDKENDLCPPFCICSCCGTQVLIYFPEIILNLDAAATIIKIPLPTYKSILISNFFGSIWQPPQII